MADVHLHDSLRENADNAATYNPPVDDNNMPNGINDPLQGAGEDLDDDDDYVVTRGYDTRRSSGRQAVRDRIEGDMSAEADRGGEENCEAPDEELELVRTPVDQIQLQIFVEQTTETRIEDDPTSPCEGAASHVRDAHMPDGGSYNASSEGSLESDTLSASQISVPSTRGTTPEDSSPKVSSKSTVAGTALE